MKRNRTIIIVLFSVLAVLLLLYFFFSGSSRKRFSWYENYSATSEQPYGVSFVKQMLAEYSDEFIFSDRKPLQYLLDSVDQRKNTDYVFIGQRLHLNDRDADALARFIEAGNTAFVASIEPPENLLNEIFDSECDVSLEYETIDRDFITMNFYHDTLDADYGWQYHYRLGEKDIPYNWSNINSDVFCESTESIVPLGYYEPDRVTFARIQYGNGSLLLHTVPLAFTNYFFTQKDKVDYASSVFSHLQGKTIIWDEFSKVNFTGNNNGNNSPLYYLLQQPSLKYAWWILLITVLLYVLFTAKRKQRVIPVLEQKANTSLEFVTMISSLHYQNGDHLDIARKKMKYFHYFIRAKYGIHAQTFNDEHIQKLAEKSKVDRDAVRSIFAQYDLIEKHSHYNTSPDKLTDLYYAIENFYRHCK